MAPTETAKGLKSLFGSCPPLPTRAPKVLCRYKLVKAGDDDMFSPSGGSSSDNRLDQMDHWSLHLSFDEVSMKYRNFSKFDIPTNEWTKTIQREWKILKKDLPDTIYVRVYESRIDLLRAVIKGAKGTPYHDGLFFFDIHFPQNYPDEPPKVYYHSGGLRINPNLYKNGKVCLSLLNTWYGADNERWIPGESTMLQVLVSIQGLILNEKPYFNEPGYEKTRGSHHGENQSSQYNEYTLIYSLTTMVYTMKKPPKNFEDLVIGYFRDHAHRILSTCKAYSKGVRFGCAIDSGDEETASEWFKSYVERYMKTLIAAFKEVGAESLDEFMPPTLTRSKDKSFYHHSKQFCRIFCFATLSLALLSSRKMMS
ncbi:ubiquitin-conjugating enzyme 25 [Artemisia annua]|uniref:E2 ubiquitin-conjugating enzyme n=1 Tax=Artemisia annua TaxID=35608 RepID=A0A2U1MY64_ARTAN|nr:ubiquitin-conjugating enzyme 25 [Artemisia annua]